jgi:hypothetical protein
VQSLLTNVAPLLMEPTASEVRVAAQRALDLSDYDPAGAISAWAACPFAAEVTPPERQFVEAARADVLAGARQRLEWLGGLLDSVRGWVALVANTSPFAGQAILDASTAYLQMMDVALTHWNERSLSVDTEWQTMLAEQRRRQAAIDRKTVLAFSGGNYIDLFPWEL